MSETSICHFFGFTVVAIASEYYVNFTVYDTDGFGCNEAGEPTVPLYHKSGSPCYPDPVESLNDAEPYLHGGVKWDGCSNWHFDEQDRVMLHGCTRSDLERIGAIMAACWDWTAELLLSWDGKDNG